MNGYQITFFTEQDRRHKGKPVAEWLVRTAQEMGLGGCTLIAAAEGVGHDHRLHSSRFFELADQPVAVMMALTGDETERLFERLRTEGVHLFYVKTAVEFGALGDGSSV